MFFIFITYWFRPLQQQLYRDFVTLAFHTDSLRPSVNKLEFQAKWIIQAVFRSVLKNGGFQSPIPGELSQLYGNEILKITLGNKPEIVSV